MDIKYVHWCIHDLYCSAQEVNNCWKLFRRIESRAYRKNNKLANTCSCMHVRGIFLATRLSPHKYFLNLDYYFFVTFL